MAMPKFKRKQQGYAALLTVMMVGLGMTSATIGSIYSVRGAQDSNLAIHKSTQSQARAWKAAEVVRLYLEAATSTQLLDIPAGDLAVTGLYGITANVISNTTNVTGQRIQIQITAMGASNTASTTLEVVYNVDAGNAPIAKIFWSQYI